MKHPDTNKEVKVTTNGRIWFKAIYDHLGDDDYTYAWQATSDHYPACWTDGVCWDSNEYNEASAKVVNWRD